MARGLLAVLVLMGCGPEMVEAVVARDGLGTAQVRFSPPFPGTPRVELEQVTGCSGLVVAVYPQGANVLFFDPALEPCSGRNAVRLTAYRR